MITLGTGITSALRLGWLRQSAHPLGDLALGMYSRQSGSDFLPDRSGSPLQENIAH